MSSLSSSSSESPLPSSSGPTSSLPSTPLAPKPRLKSVWRSPVWEFFTVYEDKKFAKCHECAELVSRGGDNTKTFNTTNLVTHLKVNHPVVYNSFCKNEERKDSQRQVAKSGGFAALRQLTLKGSQDRVKVWDINDPRATAIHRKLGEMIALDYQPISVVEDVGFLRFVGALEPRYKVPSRKYMTETVLNKINVGIKGELMKKLHAPGVEYYSFTTDGWSTTVATHSLLSLTAHSVDQSFTKMSAVLCVEEIEGSHTGSAICAKFESAF